jgi:hypothetical protein
VAVTSVLQAFYLFVPLLVASALSGLVLKHDLWRRLRRPIDHGTTWRGHRLFGDSKTWRGVVVAVIGCLIGVALQCALVATRVDSLSLLDYSGRGAVWVGAAMGAGAMVGELPNSFAKRQLGIAPGKTTKGPLSIVFYVWDQVDLLIGAWPAISFWVAPDAEVVVASFALALVIHPTISLIGFAAGARKSAR